MLEPYGMFNHDPEQKIEVRGDSESRLGTVGIAGEYFGDRFEFGFDGAVNLGRQRVFGLDRNVINTENRGGQVILSNSHVVDQSGNKIPHVPDSAKTSAQTIINTTFQNESQNGKKIAADINVGFLTEPVDLINKNNRFRDPYTNRYDGWMFVADAAWWLYKKDLQLALTVGAASGDYNPKFDTRDEDFKGFICLQEVYSGRRVKSAFFLVDKLNP